MHLPFGKNFTSREIEHSISVFYNDFISLPWAKIWSSSSSFVLAASLISLTVFGNAYASRKAARKVRDEDRDGLKAALQQEIIVSLSGMISTLKNIDELNPDTLPDVVRLRYTITENNLVYKANLQKMGLLSPKEIAHVIFSYHTNALCFGKFIAAQAEENNKNKDSKYIIDIDWKNVVEITPYLMEKQYHVLEACRTLGGNEEVRGYLNFMEEELKNLRISYNAIKEKQKNRVA